MDAFAAILLNPPDMTGPTPAYNKRATIYGATIPFHVITWAAVLSRLYTRFKVVRQPGWDDYLIILCALLNLIALITFFLAVEHGLGKHMLSIPFDDFMNVFKFLYIQNGSYWMCAGFIKLSLLCQYLRLFKNGLLRQITIVLMGLTILWTCYWSFQAWFPCFPVSGFWDRTLNAKCWGTGFGSVEEATVSFMAFAATNMLLDIIIFLLPAFLYFKPGMNTRQALALIGLFSLGTVVLAMSILRLWTAVRHGKRDPNSYDFTWWYPLTMIVGALEVDFAIISASIPIFWPIIVSSFPQIFVTHEVQVTTHRRLHDDANADFELGRTFSVKSHASQEMLTDPLGPAKMAYAHESAAELAGHGARDIESMGTTVVVSRHQNKGW